MRLKMADFIEAITFEQDHHGDRRNLWIFQEFTKDTEY
jgi:hypothetical protein